MEKIWDLIVVGAGPAGLSISAECLYHKFGDVLILEKGATHNQTIHQYYPEAKRVDAAYLGQEAVCAGVLCFRDTTKKDFLHNANVLIRTFHPRIEYNATVDSIKKTSDSQFTLSTTGEKMYHARYVVIAIGRMGKPNRPEYFAAIPAKARAHTHFDTRKIAGQNQKILVVGGGNTAVEFALSLCEKHAVTLSYRQAVFTRLNPMNLKILEDDEAKNKIRVLRNSTLSSVGETVDGKPNVQFADGSSEMFDEVIFGIGGSSPAAFLQNAGVALDSRGTPILNSELESSVSGLFIAGELSVPPGKGSIISSFNSGKRIIEALMRRENRERQPEIVIVN